MDSRDLKQVLIVSITPYFLEKEGFWFEENLQEILSARATQNFFEDNIIFLEKNQNYNLSQFIRKLDEMGYEKVFKISEPGEFSQRGGVIDVFPINAKNAVRVDFFGNDIENILELPDIKVANEKKAKDILIKRLKSQKIFSDLKDLRAGDYLVHLDHGIARYCGIEKFEIRNSKSETTEYYVLEYAEEDKLYVPLGLERKLSRYVGFQDPHISRLGSSIWQKTKREAGQRAFENVCRKRSCRKNALCCRQ